MLPSREGQAEALLNLEWFLHVFLTHLYDQVKIVEKAIAHCETNRTKPIGLPYFTRRYPCT
jgi:hypothetical protein